VIVVSGLNVREEELEDVGVSDGVGVVDGSSEDLEDSRELDELLSLVVEGGVVVGDCEVEVGSVEVGSEVFVLGGSLVGEGSEVFGGSVGG